MTLKELSERVKDSDTEIVLTAEEWQDYWDLIQEELQNEYKQGRKTLYYKGLPVICKEWRTYEVS